MRCDPAQGGEGCRHEQSRYKDRVRGLCSFISSFQGDQSTKTNEPCVCADLEEHLAMLKSEARY